MLLDEFDEEHDSRLGPRKLRCAMLMSYCLRGARLGGAISETIIDEMFEGIDSLSESRSWASVRRFMHDYLDQVLKHVMPNNQARVVRLVGRIHRELLNDPAGAESLQKYARSAGLHPDYLSRQFKTIVGQTFREIRRMGRVARARHLLTASAIKIKSVARQVGMRDSSQFIKDFKIETGHTPREFRLICRQE